MIYQQIFITRDILYQKKCLHFFHLNMIVYCKKSLLIKIGTAKKTYLQEQRDS